MRKNTAMSIFSLDVPRYLLELERFMVPELLYHPDLMEIESPSLSESIVDCTMDCDIDIRSQLLNQIFLTGGGSMFPQLEVRLKTEIEKKLNKRGMSNIDVHIIAPNERVFSSWVGGSILAMLPEFQTQWISRSSVLPGWSSSTTLKCLKMPIFIFLI